MGLQEGFTTDSVWKDPDFYFWEFKNDAYHYGSGRKDQVLKAAQAEADRSRHMIEVYGVLKTTNFSRLVATVEPTK